MEPIYITDPESLRCVVTTLTQQKVVGLDTETTGLDPHLGRLRLLQLATPQNVYVIDLDAFNSPASNPALAPLRALLAAERPIKIVHNGKFDLKWIHKHLGTAVGRIFDTQLASILLAAGTQQSHSLAAVTERFLKQQIDKSLRTSDWTRELSRSQIAYAARDAQILIPLRAKLVELLRAAGLVECAQLEFACVPATAQIELQGIYLDKTLWLEQMAVASALREELLKQITDILEPVCGAQISLFDGAPTTINVDSPQQLAAALTKIGLKVSCTDNLTLHTLRGQHPVIELIINYRAAQKALTSFGQNFIEAIHPVTNRIHAEFQQIGAPTGRFACSNPNIQQVPHEERYRRCFRPEQGRKYIIADYSQIELRILAEFCGDDLFVGAFRHGEDLHRQTAAQIFNLDVKQVTQEQRSFAKRLNFGVVYGIGAKRLALLTGIPKEEAQQLIDRYFAQYPKLHRWLEGCAQTAARKREARTMSGRKVRIDFDPQDKAACHLAERTARNAPVQGTSADITKIALGTLVRMLDENEKLVHVIHDEIIVETTCAQAERTKAKVVEAMKEAGERYLKNVPVEVEAKIADAWIK